MGATLGGKVLWEKIASHSELGFGKGLNLFLLLFFVSSFVSALVSIDPLWSLKEFLQLAYYMLLVWTVIHILTNKSQILRMTRAWFGVVILLSLFGIFEWLTGSGLYEPEVQIHRLLLGFRDPNTSANFLLVGIALGIAQVLNRNFLFTKKLTLVTGILLLWVALILTFSRTGWIIGTLVTLSFLLLAKGKKSSRIGVVAILILLSLFILNSLAFPLLTRIQSIGSLEESSNVSHLYLWYLAVQCILDHPLFGIGTGAFPIYFRLTGLEGWVKIGSGSTYLSGQVGYFGGGMSVHNSFLQLWAEIGTIGFLAFLVLLYRVMRRAFVSLKSSKDSCYRGNLLGVIFAFGASSLHNLSITGLIDHYWMILGLLIAYLKLGERKEG